MYQELPGQTFCKSCEINTELVSDSANVTVTTCRCKRGARREPRPRPHIHFIPNCRVEPPAIVASFLGDQLRDAGYYDSSMAASMDAVTSRVCARQSGCASPVSCAFPSCASVRYLVKCVLPAWRDSAAVPLRAWRAVHVVMPMWCMPVRVFVGTLVCPCACVDACLSIHTSVGACAVVRRWRYVTTRRRMAVACCVTAAAARML